MGNDAIVVSVPKPEGVPSLNNTFGAVSNENGLFVANSVNHGTLTQIGAQTNNYYSYASQDSSATEWDKRAQMIMAWLPRLNYSNVHNGFLHLMANQRDTAALVFWQTSTIIEELLNSHETCQVAFLYLSYERRQGKTPSVKDLLGSLANQLITQRSDSSTLPSCLQVLWNKENKTADPFGNPPGMLQLEDLLSDLSSISKTFIVIDALDEIDSRQRQDLLHHLRRIKNVSILITSRDPSIKDFESVEILAHQEDIHNYIEQECDKLWYLSEQDGDLKTDIKRIITTKANGIFLLVRSHMEIIAALTDRGEIRTALERLPSDPNSMYTNTLQRIRNQEDPKRRWTMAILGWMVHVYRPLDFEELRHALLIGGPVELPLQAGDVSFEHSSMLSRETILALCCGLVETDSSRCDSLRLIHFTAMEFFAERSAELFPGFDARIALACAKYLSIPRLEVPDPSIPEVRHRQYTDSDYRDGRNNYTEEFKEYGRLQDHCKSREEMKLGKKIKEFDEHTYVMKCSTFSKEMNVMLPGLPDKRYTNGSGVLTQLTIELKLWLYPFLAYAGKYLAHHCRKISHDNDRSPVDYQIRKIWDSPAKLKLVEWLLDNIGYRRTLGLKTLTDYAAFFGSPTLVQISGDREKAFRIAINNGCQDVVRALLSSGPMVDLSTPRGHSTLLSAAQKGSLQAVNDFVCIISDNLDKAKKYHKSVTRRTKDWFGRRPPLDASGHDYYFPGLSLIEIEGYIRLLLASTRGDAGVISKLIEEKCIDLPLIASVELSKTTLKQKGVQESQVKALLTTTSFFLCVENCHTQAASVFLDHGTSVESLDFESQRPLHRAVHRNSHKMAELLLSRGARTDVKDINGQPVWRMSTGPDRAEVLERLIESSADAGASALYSAVYDGDVELLQMAVRFGADPSFREQNGETPLHMACQCDQAQLTSILLEAGADHSIQGLNGRTPLHIAAYWGFNDCLKLLLEHGADVSMQDNNGSTALHLAICDANEKCVELLLHHGAKIDLASEGKIDPRRISLKHFLGDGE
ncbi:ankyrin repeat-containing domain protein [Phyllosticta paracitricarpa]